MTLLEVDYVQQWLMFGGEPQLRVAKAPRLSPGALVASVNEGPVDYRTYFRRLVGQTRSRVALVGFDNAGHSVSILGVPLA